ALESAHALAHALKLAPTLGSKQNLLVCLSGRGDKDMASVEAFLSTQGGISGVKASDPKVV
ncbi:MAG: hypothetical protein ACREKE_04365, partial [bacterium]